MVGRNVTVTAQLRPAFKVVGQVVESTR